MSFCPPCHNGSDSLIMPHSDRAPSPPSASFPDLPPFPDNLPTAPLLRISLQKLLQHDADEQERGWKACCELGFFYLDLRTSHPGNEDEKSSIDGNAILKNAEQLFEEGMKSFFDLDVEEKVKYDFKDQGSYFGYKGYGAGYVDKQGTRDRNEFYNVSCSTIVEGDFVDLKFSRSQKMISLI